MDKLDSTDFGNESDCVEALRFVVNLVFGPERARDFTISDAMQAIIIVSAQVQRMQAEQQNNKK